jgi:hypothetical protein
MPIIQTSLTQSDSASPEDTTLYVYNMSIFLVTCLLNRCQRASSAGCLQSRSEAWPHHEARSFPFPTTQMPLAIRSEIKEQGDSQDCWHNVEHCHLNLDDNQIGHEGAGRSTDTVPSAVLPESFFERDLSEHNRQTQSRMEWGTNSPRDVNFILQWSLYRGGKNGTSLKFFLFKNNKNCCVCSGSF